MDPITFVGLIHNAALLLSMSLIYDTVAATWNKDTRRWQQAAIGAVIGGMGVVIMLTPWEFASGVFFDTRSVLLSITGLFFGPVPTMVAVLLTAAFRFYQGGAGAWTGVAVIITSGAIGVGWRHFRGQKLADFSWREFYLLGVAVHVAMLLWMFTLPGDAGPKVLGVISLPVMVIYPLGETLLGKLMSNRLRRIRLRDDLQVSEEKYRFLTENIKDVVWILDTHTMRFVYVSPSVEKMRGYTAEEVMALPVDAALTPEAGSYLTGLILERQGAYLAGQFDADFFFTDELQQPCKDGLLIWVEVVSGYSRNQKTGHVELRGVTRNINERKQAEQALKQSQSAYRQIVETANEGIWVMDNRLLTTYVNQKMANMLGYQPEEMIGLAVSHFMFEIDLPDHAEKMDHRQSGLDEKYERRFRRQDGSECWTIVSATALNTESGQFAGSFAMFTDINDRKQAEENLKTALAEKETLLRELYHRTKNNMHIIKAMLTMRAMDTDDDTVKTMLYDISNRIQTMAMVHQMLYQAQDLSRISLHLYIEELAQLMLGSYRLTASRVTINFELTPIEVLIDIAIPCGLILNELITNALKYAFPNHRPGRIDLRLNRPAPEVIEIVIADNGVGVPPEFDFRTQPSLGLKTVITLVEHQLGGTISFDTSNGVACRILLPDSHYHPRV